MTDLTTLRDRLDAVVFDVGDTLVHAAPVGTPIDELEVRLRTDVLEDLTALHDAGLRVGAVTDTSVMTERAVRELLAASGVDGLLEVVVTSVDVGAAKPDPMSLRTAIGRLGVDASRTLYIGDAVVDRDAAQAAGTAFAFVGETILATLDRWVGVRSGRFEEIRQGWSPPTDPAEDASARLAQERFDALAKPTGSLGRLEALGGRLAAIAGSCPPPRPTPAVVAVFAADHGVHGAGVTAWPQEITAAMVGVMASGRASVQALAAAVGATVVVVDVGVAHRVGPVDGIVDRAVRTGTRDLSVETAMTLSEVSRALDVGAEVAEELIDGGARCLVTGEMGIGNTTPAAALVAAYCGRTAAEVAGRGAGADDETLARKVAAIDAGLSRHAPGDDPLVVLASLGGLEIAAMAGFLAAATSRRVPVVVDGVIADAALLAAERLLPGVRHRVVAGHRSTEPAATIALEELGLEPLLDLDMRLGEGTGAVLALPLLDAAVRALTDVATIADVTGG